MQTTSSVNSMPTSLIHEIAVSGHTLAAMRDGTKVWVSVRSVCSSLGIDTSGQVRKLQKKTWATLRTDFQHMAADGKMRQMILIDVECLPQWLTTIEAGRVSVELGDRLLTLQQRAAVAVKEHFFGTASPKGREIIVRDYGNMPGKCSSCDLLCDAQTIGSACVNCKGTFVAKAVPNARQHLVAQAEALVAQAKAIDSQRGEIAELRDMLTAIQSRQQLAATRLLEAPSAETPPEVPLRRWIDAMIAELATKTGKDHHESWRLVYRGLKLHYGIDAYARARNATKANGGKEVAKIDALESAGSLGKVYAVAKELVRQAGEGGVADRPALGRTDVAPKSGMTSRLPAVVR